MNHRQLITKALAGFFERRVILDPLRTLIDDEHFVDSLQNLILIIGGGFLVGFGTRYANGCTSGHAIMGVSLLSVGSMVATVGFFIGGLIFSQLVLPAIMSIGG